MPAPLAPGDLLLMPSGLVVRVSSVTDGLAQCRYAINARRVVEMRADVLERIARPLFDVPEPVTDGPI